MASTCIDMSACARVRESSGSLMCHYPSLDVFLNYKVIVTTQLAYLIGIYALVKFMAKRPAYDVSRAMQIYNIYQIAISLATAISLTPILLNNFFNISSPSCPYIELWTFVHYACKTVDMLDSVWMALRKKNDQLTFLHVYHHFSIGIVWFALLHNGHGGGVGGFGAWINSVVHTVMYGHYLITSMGYRNPIKKYITQLQMLQFLLCILQGALVTFLETQIPWQWGIVQLCYHVSLFALFKHFYSTKVSKEGSPTTPPPKKKKVS